MPFTSLGTAIAAIAFMLGCIQLTLGLGILTGLVAQRRLNLFLGDATVSETIDSGLFTILIAVGFGVMTEISRAVAK